MKTLLLNCTHLFFLGSVTLRQWQQLATPKIEGLFESRPGVATRGDRKLDIEVETYNISDFEEDGRILLNTVYFLSLFDFFFNTASINQSELQQYLYTF